MPVNSRHNLSTQIHVYKFTAVGPEQKIFVSSENLEDNNVRSETRKCHFLNWEDECEVEDSGPSLIMWLGLPGHLVESS